MSFFRSTALRTAIVRPAFRPATRSALPVTSQRFFSSQDYGSGEGDPAGEKPQDQGPSKSSDLEHPGPPPPDVGKGTGTTPTKAGSKGHNAGENSQGSSKPSSSSSKSSSGSSSDSSVKGAKPKILNDNPPEDPSEEVKQHNREMENRAERAEVKIDNRDTKKDKVSPKFWSGQGGADRDP